MQKLHALLDTHVITAVVLILVIVGGVKSIGGDLDYPLYIKIVSPLVIGAALGRGIAAYKK